MSGEIQKSVVLKSAVHCEECLVKLLKALRKLDGVENVTCAEPMRLNLNVIGNFDPVTLRKKVEQKTHNHVEILLPKEDGKGRDGGGGGGGEGKKKQDNKGVERKAKEKEPPITTAVLKISLHCEGCIQKIYNIVTKFEGYKEMKIENDDLVKVTGSMDIEELVKTLKKHLKKDIEIVSYNGGVKGKGKGKGGEGRGEAKGKSRELSGTGSGEKIMIDNNGMQQQQVQYPYTESAHAPQLFSDENPNACCVM